MCETKQPNPPTHSHRHRFTYNNELCQHLYTTCYLNDKRSFTYYWFSMGPEVNHDPLVPPKDKIYSRFRYFESFETYSHLM